MPRILPSGQTFGPNLGGLGEEFLDSEPLDQARFQIRASLASSGIHARVAMQQYVDASRGAAKA